MRIKLIKIGNSKGIRLPKTVLNECQFQDEIELQVYQKTVLLSPVRIQRKMWASVIEQAVLKNKELKKEEWEW